MHDSNFHVDDERLALYTMRRLSPEEEASMEEHLLICAECREQSDEITKLVSTGAPN